MNLGQRLKSAPQLLDILQHTPPVLALRCNQHALSARLPRREPHHLAEQIEDAVDVVALREGYAGWDGGLRGVRGEEGLGAEVVGEGEGLDELLEAGEPVAVAVLAGEVRGDGGEGVVDLGELGVYFLFNGGGGVLVDGGSSSGGLV